MKETAFAAIVRSCFFIWRNPALVAQIAMSYLGKH